MRAMNLISATNIFEFTKNEDISDFNMKQPDKNVIDMLISEFNNIANPNEIIEIFDGYYIGYTIPQIGKEFDLLRFGVDSVINIELKSKGVNELNASDKENKIKEQLIKNQYYLSFLKTKKVYLFTFVEDDGFYEYDAKSDTLNKVSTKKLTDLIFEQKLDRNCEIERLFLPENYLVSVFNNTRGFLAQKYFLTVQQDNIKKEILSSIRNNQGKFWCISADAGTGKTLLLYDIALTLKQQTKECLIIHCGQLNDGHHNLIEKDFSICGVKGCIASVERFINTIEKVVIIDEAHRLSVQQLERIADLCCQKDVTIIFAYDVNQFLKEGEDTDIYKYLKNHKPKLISKLVEKKLTTKIRTNHEIASFIKNLKKIGKDKDYKKEYDNVTIEYFNDYEDARNYIYWLEKDNWKSITYSNSLYGMESISFISNLCSTNSHKVIGQEFSKVVTIMDFNFKYSDTGMLQVYSTYYSLEGMLYQNLTRAVSKLKIVVVKNQQLYCDLIRIKNKEF